MVKQIEVRWGRGGLYGWCCGPWGCSEVGSGWLLLGGVHSGRVGRGGGGNGILGVSGLWLGLGWMAWQLVQGGVRKLGLIVGPGLGGRGGPALDLGCGAFGFEVPRLSAVG